MKKKKEFQKYQENTVRNTTKKPDTTEIAAINRDHDYTYGFIGKILQNPDAILKKQTSEGIKIYDTIMQDAHVYSVMQTRKLAVVNLEWEVYPASGRLKDKKIAEFIKTSLSSINFERAKEGLLSAVSHGYAVIEVMWAIADDGSAVVKEFIGRPQRRFTFDEEGKLRLLTRNSPLEGEEVPDKKFIVHTLGDHSENPFGLGVGSKLYWPWWFKKHGIKFWTIFSEKFGMPTAVGWYPTGTGEKERTDLLTVLDAIQNETGITLPEGFKVEFLEAQRSGSIDNYERYCAYMDAQISKAVLGQTLTTEVGSTGGAYAASKTHNDVRGDIVKADADLLSETLNKTIVRWLVDYNFSGVTEYPELWLKTEKDENLNEAIQRDIILIRDIGLPVSKEYLYKKYNLPSPENDEDIISLLPASQSTSAFAEADLKKKISALINR